MNQLSLLEEMKVKKVIDKKIKLDDEVVDEKLTDNKFIDKNIDKIINGSVDKKPTDKKIFHGNHILSVKQFTREDLDHLFKVADIMQDIVNKHGTCNIAQGKTMVNLFYEPSTRTSSSFHSAMMRLGGMVLPITDTSTSSVAKGESLADTVKALESYADVIVLRHPNMGSADLAASHLKIPLINAGDGIGEHPTQALLDIYTILSELKLCKSKLPSQSEIKSSIQYDPKSSMQYESKSSEKEIDNNYISKANPVGSKSLSGLTITMVGDLEHSRTAHSLAYILALYQDITINYVSPKNLCMPNSVISDVDRISWQMKTRISQNEYLELDSVLSSTDVLYVTRLQKERFSIYDGKFNDGKIDNDKFNDGKINDDKFNDGKINDGKFNDGKFNDDKFNDGKINDGKFNNGKIGSQEMLPCITPELLTRLNAKPTLCILHPLPRVDELSTKLNSDPRASYFRQTRYGLFVRMALLCLVLGCDPNKECISKSSSNSGTMSKTMINSYDKSRISKQTMNTLFIFIHCFFLIIALIRVIVIW